MIKLKLLVVLYNRLPMDSETIQSIITAKNDISKFSELIIWDNSERMLSNIELEDLSTSLIGIKYEYYADGKNTYLSVIYNRIIKKIQNDDYLIILDHDSNIEISFFNELVVAINENPNVNLFLPIIISHNTIVSPANMCYFYGSNWKESKFGLIKSKGTTAINSGMTISGNYLKNKFEGYNEDIRFYGTDNDFMYKYAKDNKYIYILNSKINHTLNYQHDNNLEDKIRRFADVKFGFYMNAKSQNYFVYFLAKIYFFLYSLKLSISHKTIRFLLNSRLR